MRKFRLKVYHVLLTLCFGYVNCDLDSPCPQIWTYTTVHNDLRGLIEVPSPYTNVLKLDVRLTVGNKVEGYNGQIQLFSSKDQSAKDFSEARPVKYIVSFPFWYKYPPKVTRIRVNGEIVCYGPGLSLEQVPILTTIDLEHVLTISSPPKRVGGSYPINPSNANPQGNRNDQDLVQGHQGNAFIKDVVEPSNQNLPNYYNHRQQNTYNNYKPPQNFNYQYDRNPYYNTHPYYNRPYDTTTEQPKPQDHLPQLPPSNLPPPPFNTDNNFHYHTKPPFTFSPSDSTTPSNPNGIPSVGSRQDFLTQSESILGPSEGCGITEKNVVQLLAHAEPVVDVRYPWLVAIFIKTDRSLNFACGGSLISYRHVISAAHCFPDDDPEAYQFVMSDNMRQLFSFEDKTVREAERLVRHPQYLPKSADADIAIAVLRTPVPSDRHIRPVCLWNEEIDIRLVVGMYGKVVGWGQDENNQLAKKSPKEVNMPILDAAECVQSNALFSEFVSERSFCAGYKNGTGPCFGDSGSGFFMNRNGRHTLRGIVSITILDNISECKISDYSALTDVSKFGDWVKGILNR